MARQLFVGCLEPPAEGNVVALAKAVNATPYSEARRKRELGPQAPVIIPDQTKAGEAYRTLDTVTVFRGWDLPGEGTGVLVYTESIERQDHIEQATSQATTAVKASRQRACVFTAAVSSGRAMFLLYETLHADNYGMLITADRRRVIVFRFDEDGYDIELSFALTRAIPGISSGQEPEGNSRVVLSDGGPRFINSVVPGIPTVTLTREGLLSALDQPATISFGNTVIEPMVQRIASVDGPGAS